MRSLGCLCADVSRKYVQCSVKDQFRVSHATGLHDKVFLEVVKIVITL